MNKKVGETPLACLDRLRLEKPELAGEPMTYAGRLDPMADGLLLVLVGEECKHREDFLGLDKEYITEILWGVATDTYDILGKIIDQKTVQEFKIPDLQKFVGKHQQKFPPYSSKPVNGKPLHEWAREDRLAEIEIPSKEIEIKSIELLETRQVPVNEIATEITQRLFLIKGDFRQNEIKGLWNEYFGSTATLGSNLTISKLSIRCSTGTYIRGLVQELGQATGFGATVLSLRRTKVGDYNLI